MIPRRRIIPVFVPHAGCPNDCVFCNQRRIAGVNAPASAEEAARIIGGALSIVPVGAEAEVAFYGGSFTAMPLEEQESLLEVARPFLAEGRLKSLRVSTRPDCVDDAAAARLREYGVKTVEIGVQSMDAEVLRLSKRGHTPEDTVLAAGLLKRFGFSVILQMMTGLPGDTSEKSVETARRIAALSPDGVRVYPTVVVEGSELADMWRRGEYSAASVSEAADLCADILAALGNIPVIRLGLNPTDGLSGGSVLAGPYHPAFGEIARSRLYLRRAREVLRGLSPVPDEAAFMVGPGKAGLMSGHRGENVRLLREEFSLRRVRIFTGDVGGEIVRLLP